MAAKLGFSGRRSLRKSVGEIVKVGGNVEVVGSLWKDVKMAVATKVAVAPLGFGTAFAAPPHTRHQPKS